MRTAYRTALALGVAALIACPALAQPPGGGRGGPGMGGGGVAMLLMQKGVQDELKITPEQVQKAQEAMMGVREKLSEEDRAKLRDFNAPREERDAINKKMQELIQKEVAGIFNADQQKRLKQLVIQQEGPQAFVSNEEVTKALKLTDEQKDKVKTIAGDYTKDTQALRPGGGGAGGRPGGGGAGGFDPTQMQENFKKREALRKEYTTKVISVLTPDQKKTYDDLTGKQFAFEMPQFGGARRPDR